MTNEEMKNLILLVESAEQLDEINFKKAAATAMAVGALAGAPQDAQADDAAKDPQLDKPVATQQIDNPKDIIVHRPDKKFKDQGYHYKWNGITKAELKDNLGIIHKNRPKELGAKTGPVDMKANDFGRQFKSNGLIKATMGSTHLVSIPYENGEMILYLNPSAKVPLKVPGVMGKMPVSVDVGMGAKIDTGNGKWVPMAVEYIIGSDDKKQDNVDLDFDEGIKDNLKKAAATAMAVGALAGAPQDAQADNSMSDPQLDKPVATQQADVDNNKDQPKGDILVDGLYAGMSIEQVLEAVPGAKTSRGSGNAIWYGAEKKSIKVKAGKTQFEFDANDKLVGVHKMMHPRKDPRFKEVYKLFGHPATEFKTVFTKAYMAVKGEMGSATGKVETMDGVKFGLGIGAITTKGAFMLGLDKTGTSSATVPTTNGSMTMISLTQSGMRNAFTPNGIVLSYHAPRAQSELEFN